MMQRFDEVLSEMKSEATKHEFLKTGFPILDDRLDGGFVKKELVIIGGNSGIGKSYLAGQIFMNIAEQGFNAGYFSLEISNETVISRLIGMKANVKPIRVQFGLLSPTEYDSRIRAEGAIQLFSGSMGFYDDVYLLETILKEIEEQKLEFVVVDFIQNVDTKETDEYSRLSKVALDLQKAAKQYNCCILALSQQSNSAAREGAESKNLEYKGSGNIKTVCDLGFILERGDYLEGAMFQEIKLSLKKNRRGMDGQIFSMRFKFPGGEITETA